MTGFGNAKLSYLKKQIVVEIKSVNSKQLDLFLKLPSSLRIYESEFRTIIADYVERGKIDFCISFEGDFSDKKILFDRKTAQKYYHELFSFAKEIHQEKSDILSKVLTLPDVFKQEIATADSNEITKVKEAIGIALNKFNKFRADEGKLLGKDFQKRINNILNLFKKIDPLDKKRIIQVRKRIDNHLNQTIVKDKIDKNRFEEELIYYLEKMDITEEKLRLKTHCNYFLDTLIKEESSGRKLGFISQEIGREINTIGSKANDAEIQKIVVQMKDELEKIKEQLMNVL